MPLPGVSARIVDPETESPLPDGEVGEVQIKGAHVCKGYWQQPKKTAEAFTRLMAGCAPAIWARASRMVISRSKGRAKDLIITGGMNVYPPEVELALMEHPAVAACAVIGCPDDEWGEQVVAVIIARKRVRNG